MIHSVLHRGGIAISHIPALKKKFQIPQVLIEAWGCSSTWNVVQQNTCTDMLTWEVTITLQAISLRERLTCNEELNSWFILLSIEVGVRGHESGQVMFSKCHSRGIVQQWWLVVTQKFAQLVGKKHGNACKNYFQWYEILRSANSTEKALVKYAQETSWLSRGRRKRRVIYTTWYAFRCHQPITS